MKSPRKSLWVVLAFLALLAVGCSRMGNSGRSDLQVATDVQNKINSDGSVPDKQITINANNGVVTLTGNVSSDAARNAAANDAGHVDGVKTVINNLEVAPAVASTLPQEATEPVPPQPMVSNPAPARSERPSPRTRTRSRASSGVERSESASNNSSNGNGLGTTVPSNDNPSTGSTAGLQPSTPPPPAAPQKITIPAGTQLAIRLNQELDSEKAQVGDVFRGSISAPITIDGETVIPTTADVEGRVVDVKSAGRFAGQSVLTLQLTRLLMNGKSYTLTTDQWTKSGSGRGKATAAKVGGGAAVGAILGGIFGGGKGAAIGAAAGAGAGTGVSAATKGQQILLKPEAVISFTTQNPLTVTPAANRQSSLQ
jgi:hypothetical protein